MDSWTVCRFRATSADATSAAGHSTDVASSSSVSFEIDCVGGGNSAVSATRSDGDDAVV